MDIFTGDQPAISIDPEKDYTPDLVGEDKKYKTTADLARSVLHKDAFIEQLKTEAANARNELKTRMTMDEFLVKLESKAPSNEAHQAREPEAPAQPVTLPDFDFEKVIEQKMNEAEAKRKADGNVRAVVAKLHETFGENYSQKVKSLAQSLGLNEEFLNSVAAKSPQAFFQLLGVNQSRQRDNTVPDNSVSTFRPNSGNTRNATYYNDLRIKMGNARFFADLKIQKQQFEDLKTLGPEEYNR